MVYLLAESCDQWTRWKFPGGEVGITCKDSSSLDGNILARIHNSDDLIEVALAADIVKDMMGYATLSIGYLPYARQDRRDVGASLSIKVIANILDSCEFDWIRVLDAHSDVAAACFKTPISVDSPCEYFDDFLRMSGISTGKVCLVSPDAGASKKTQKIYESLDDSRAGLIQFIKQRDPATGKLSNIRCIDTVDPDAYDHFVVVDDICDGGGTFLGIANVLGSLGVPFEKRSLFVSHGIFSGKAHATLPFAFKNIGCTDSWQPARNYPDFIKVVPYFFSVQVTN